MNAAVLVIRLQYQCGPEVGCPNEDTYFGHPLRAAVRILMAIQPKLSGPIQVARNLFTRALFEPTKQSLSCLRERFHLSSPFVAPASEKQLSTGRFRDVGKIIRGKRNA